MERRLDRAQELFEAALEQPTAMRDAWLRQACAGDDVVYEEVASLLASDVEEAAFLDTPVAELGTEVPEAEPALAVGAQIGPYVIEAQLGAGGFGAVYRARHGVIGRLAAIKVLHPEHASSKALTERFVNEARAVNEIRHPNIVDVFDFGQTPDGRLYSAMEYVDAPSLEQVLAREGRLTLAHALPILRGLAAALDAAHDRGIVHRDLKPANVLVTRDVDRAPVPKLLDFGIAKLAREDVPGPRTMTGQLLGTPAYMAPEQIRGEAVDGRTDAYAFGVLAYRMLTGTPPFHASNAFDIMVQHAQQEAAAPSTVVPELGAAVDDLVLRLLAKDPHHRPTRLLAVVDALAASEPATDGRAGRRDATRRGPTAVAILVVALVVGLVAWSVIDVPPRPTSLPSDASAIENGAIDPGSMSAPEPRPPEPAMPDDPATRARPTPADPPAPRAVDPASATSPTSGSKRRALHGDLESPFGR